MPDISKRISGSFRHHCAKVGYIGGTLLSMVVGTAAATPDLYGPILPGRQGVGVHADTDTVSAVAMKFPDPAMTDEEGVREYLDSTPLPSRSPGRRAAVGKRPIRVLFIGNSLTYVNGLPMRLKALLAAGHHPCVVGAVTNGGATLQRLWYAGRAPWVLQHYLWDDVVLQERPIPTVETFLPMAQRFAKLAEAKHAHVVLFVPFPNLTGPPGGQAIVEAVNDTVAQAVHATLAFLPAAWDAVAADTVPDMLDPDGMHPGPAGAYLNALVFYRLLTGESPVGLPLGAGANGLPARDVALLQRAAEAAFTSDATRSKR